ncbi:MAG: hypothetical protein ACI8ZM_004459 [Crocinitomix sp.]|jgi:hypothetical protein
MFKRIMGELVGLLIVGGLLISWILAGINYSKEGVLLHFFGHLGCCAILIVVFWGIIVYPVLHCGGFLCGLSEILLFMALSAATILIWGLILLIYSNKHFSKNKERIHTGKHETVDTPQAEDVEF